MVLFDETGRDAGSRRSFGAWWQATSKNTWFKNIAFLFFVSLGAAGMLGVMAWAWFTPEPERPKAEPIFHAGMTADEVVIGDTGSRMWDSPYLDGQVRLVVDDMIAKALEQRDAEWEARMRVMVDRAVADALAEHLWGTTQAEDSGSSFYERRLETAAGSR